MDELKAAACKYAIKGISVLPLVPKGKPPKIKGGVHSASSEMPQVVDWWTQWPDANIGIATGKVNGGLVVIDIDVKKGAKGEESIKHWQEQNGKLPETLTAMTPSGGRHLFYRVKDCEYGNRAGLLPGVDIRANGGYVVAAPSVTEEGAYTWLTENGKVTDANDTVLMLLNWGKLEDMAPKPFKLPEVIEEGSRNTVLFQLGCSLRDKGLEYPAILAALRETNATLQDPLEDDEVLATARSASRYEKKHDVTVEKGKTKPVEPPRPFESYSMQELAQMDLHPPDMIVADLLPVGLGILAAPSKAGKSFMVLDMGLLVAQGRSFLGKTTNQCDVLYLALEDSLYRVNSRMAKILADAEPPGNMRVTIESKKTNDGLPQQIDLHMQQYPGTRLIIIDTFQMVKPPKGSRDAYEFDYEVMGQLKPLTVKYNISILLVHHTRKSNGRESDPFEEILGSTALQGATDFMYILKKTPKDDFSVLYGKGRDIENIEMAVKMNWAAFKWESLGDVRTMETMRAELEYRNHPAMVTLRYKLESIEADPEEPIKAYVVRMKDFRNDIADYLGEVVGTSEQAFKSEVERFDVLLLAKDRIEHKKPQGRTRWNGKQGYWHRYQRKH